MEDVVYLRNGSVIRGAIVELSPDGNIKIQMSDGSIFVFPFADVERVAKEEAFTQSRTALPPRKEPGVAFLLSLVVTGGGQFYNGEIGKAATMLAMAVAGWMVFFAMYPEEEVDCTEYRGCFVIGESGDKGSAYMGLALAGVMSIISMIDAPLTASRMNREHGYSLRGMPMRDQASVYLLPTYSSGLGVGARLGVRWEF